MADEETTPPAANPTEATVDLAGRRDVNDLAQAYRASGDEARRQKERADRAEALLAQQLQAATPREVNTRSNPADRLAELGIPIDALDDYFNQRVATTIVQPLTELSNRQTQGRQRMLATYGEDYSKYEADVARFVASDPERTQEYQRLYNSDPASAMKLAYLDFAEAKRREAPRDASNGVDQDQQSQARIPSQRGSGKPKDSDSYNERVGKARENWEKYPSRQTAEAYAKARLSRVVTDEHLGL